MQCLAYAYKDDTATCLLLDVKSKGLERSVQKNVAVFEKNCVAGAKRVCKTAEKNVAAQNLCIRSPAFSKIEGFYLEGFDSLKAMATPSVDEVK